MKVNRSELLNVLETVQPGLTARDIVEQSSCFAFKDGEVCTFNDEVACRRKSPLDITGAVHAAPLLTVLRKLPEDFVDIRVEDNQLVVKGKGRRSAIRLQEEVLLPIEKVENADDWRKLHEDFSDAIYVAQQCVGKDESNYAATCIHIHPNYIEACDNYQAVRYKIKTRVREPILVRGASIKHIIGMDMTDFAETDNWIHFRSSTGLIISCRRDTQEYESLDQILEVSGEKITLPKGVAEAADRAETFSAENADENEVTVSIRPGKFKVLGEGVSGWYYETKKIKYKGNPISFRISPKLLIEITKRYNDCIIGQGRLRVDGGKFVYVAALGAESNGESE